MPDQMRIKGRDGDGGDDRRPSKGLHGIQREVSAGRCLRNAGIGLQSWKYTVRNSYAAARTEQRATSAGCILAARSGCCRMAAKAGIGMNYIWGGMILTGVIYGTLTGHIDAVSDALLSSSKEAVTLCITMLGVMGLWMGLMETAKDAGLIRAISERIQPLIHFLFPDLPAGHPAAEHITTNIVANFLGLGWAATPAGLKAMESLAELEEERRTEAETERGTDVAQQMADAGQPSDRYQMENENVSARKEEDRYARRAAAERQDANAIQAPDRYRAKEEHVGKTATAQRATDETQRTEKTVQQAAGTKSRRRIQAVPRGVASNEMCTFLILNISSLQLIPVNVIAYRAQYGSVNPTAIVGPGIAATMVSTLVAMAFCKVMDRKV